MATRESIRQAMIDLKKYLNSDLVFFLNVHSREEALQEMVQKIDKQGYLHHLKEFYQAILEREKIVSTSIGMGVAIPHAKLPTYDDFFIAIAIVKQGIEWDAMDQMPIRLIFMIGGPDDKQTEYLQILSCVTLAIKDDERRKKLLNCHSANELIAHLEGF